MWRETWWGVCFGHKHLPSTFLGLFLICTIFLERTLRLAATKECIVLPKKIKSYVAMIFCKNVGLVSLCADIYLPREGSGYTCISNYYFIDPVHLIGWVPGHQRAAWGCLHRGDLVQSCPNVFGAAYRSHCSRCRYFKSSVILTKSGIFLLTCLLTKYLCRKLCNRQPVWEHRSHSRASAPSHFFLLGQCKLLQCGDDGLSCS